MTWRARVRTSLVYLVSIAAGFALSYLVVAFVVFPSGSRRTEDRKSVV